MSGEVRINDFIFDSSQQIGKGTSGVVYLGHRVGNSDFKVAIKKIEIPDLNEQMKRLWNEIAIMKKLQHPNIIRLYDVHLDFTKNCLYLILEYCSSDLAKYLNSSRYQITKAREIAIQIRDGLQYLNQQGIVHRDLKPHNLLLTDQGVVKIADFGLSVTVNSQLDLLKTMCGSPLYMSPEIIDGDKYTAKSDLWSVGLIYYQLIYGVHPYGDCRKFNQLTNRVKADQIKYPSKPLVDPVLLDLLKRLLLKNPHQRISWFEFFNHPWFKLEQEEEMINSAGACSDQEEEFISSDEEEDLIFSITEEADDRMKIKKSWIADQRSLAGTTDEIAESLDLSRYLVENYQSAPVNIVRKGERRMVKSSRRNSVRLGSGVPRSAPSRMLDQGGDKKRIKRLGSEAKLDSGSGSLESRLEKVNNLRREADQSIDVEEIRGEPQSSFDYSIETFHSLGNGLASILARSYSFFRSSIDWS